jgi:O-antigen/teichoic acid export membrane protein
LSINKLLVNNILINITGFVIPLFIGLITIPLIIDQLGLEKFGILTIIWMLIGYFSLFDFGLSRSLTKFISEKIGADDSESIPFIVFNAFLLILFASFIGTCLIFFSTENITYDLLNIPPSLQQQTIQSLNIVALAIPFVIFSAGIRGVFEAFQQFKVVSINKVVLGSYTFVSPLLLLPFTNNLSSIVFALLLGRALSFLFLVIKIRQLLNIKKEHRQFDKKYLVPLLSMSGWMTVTNIIGPFMIYIDRFFIGMILTMTAVAYYVTPYEIVTKLLVLPIAILGVMFPAFSSANEKSKDTVALYFRRTMNAISAMLFVICMVIILFSAEGLTLWLGGTFAEKSTLVLQLLAVGIFINSIAFVPFSLLQGIGRADITAKFHLIEFVIYIPFLWYAISNFGIDGAAFIWMGRVVIDFLLLFVATKKLLVESTRYINNFLLVVLISSGLFFIPIYYDFLMMDKIFYLIISIVVFIGSMFVFLFKQFEVDGL